MPSEKSPTAQAIISAIEALASRINPYPFGRLQIEWQDGKPVLVEVTTKHKPP